MNVMFLFADCFDRRILVRSLVQQLFIKRRAEYLSNI